MIPTPLIPTLKCALSQPVSSSPTHSHPTKCALSKSASPSSPTPIPLSSALSPSRCLPPSHLSHYQVRSLPVGVSLPHTTPTLKCALSQLVSPSFTHSLPLSSAPSPSRCLPPPFLSLYQVRSLPVGVSLLYSFHLIKCANSQSASFFPTPLPLSSALSPSRCLPPPFIPFHSQVRSLPVGISLFHSFPSTLKCALSQSASPSSTQSHLIKCALSQSASPSFTPITLSSALSPSRCLSPHIPFHS